MYTTVEQVRPYLTADYPVFEQVTDQPLQLKDTSWSQFYGGSIDPASLRVKSKRAAILARQQLTIGSAPLPFSSDPVARGSIIVASDSSLGSVYEENSDFTVDYPARTLTPTPSSRLAVGQSITIWYETYHLFQDGTDYQLNSELSRIRRLASGNIPSGETLFLDYTPTYHSFTDASLLSAVTEANGLIEQEVDPNGQFGAEPTLIAAATCRALEIICRSAATRELSSLRGQDKISLAWLKLADDYSSRADRLLQSFRPPIIGPASPTIS